MRFELAYPLFAAAGGMLAIIAIGSLWRNRRSTGYPAAVALSLAAFCGAIAAGIPRLTIKATSPVNVLLDLSASTRSAGYRDPAKLNTRLRELIPAGRFHIATFGEHERRTIVPPIREPTLLFSDGQFAKPDAAAPVFCVIDPTLASANDARIEAMVHERGQTLAIINNTGSPRTFDNGGDALAISTGRFRVNVGSAFHPATVRLSSGDPWPENDTLSSPALAPPAINRICVGVPAPPGYERYERVDLPADASAYLSTALLILDAGDAAHLTTAQQSAIITWVRDLGGSLLLIGSDAAWADMRQSPLEEICPLSVDPPAPQTQWIILMDASGSMAQVEADKPKWQRAMDAAIAAAKTLPAKDNVRLGSFAANVRWWHTAPADELTFTAPLGFSPRGPTNLEAALNTILALPASQNSQVFLLTDAEVELGDPARLAQAFRDRSLPVHCLALSDGRGIAALRQFTSATGGRMSLETSPAAWAAASRQLAGQIAPARWHTTPLAVTLRSPLSDATMMLPRWNNAWPRQGANVFASGHDAGRTLSLAATWPVSLGNVSAIAWPMSASDLAPLATELEHLPTDSRYRVQWLNDDRLLRVEGDAENVTLRMAAGAENHTTNVPRIAPGLFQINFTPPTAGGAIAVIADARIIAARSFTPRYAPEFDAIGINRESLQSLAQDTGGKLIEASNHTALNLDFSPHMLALAPWLGIAAVALSGTALLLLRTVRPGGKPNVVPSVPAANQRTWRAIARSMLRLSMRSGRTR